MEELYQDLLVNERLDKKFALEIRKPIIEHMRKQGLSDMEISKLLGIYIPKDFA